MWTDGEENDGALPLNEVDPKAEREAGKRDKKLAYIRAYKQFFETDSGRYVLWDMMKQCHFRGTSYSPNPQEMAFNEGRRSVILDILKITETDERKILDFFQKSIEHLEGDEDEDFI